MVKILTALTASEASNTFTVVVLLPCGNPITGHTSTPEPARTSFASGIEYGLMHAVAVLYLICIHLSIWCGI